MHAGNRGQLNAVEGHNLGVLADSAHNLERLEPAQAVGLGRAGGGDNAGVEAVDVDGQKDLFAFDALDELGQVAAGVDIVVEPDAGGVGRGADVVHLFLADRANAKLQDIGAQIGDASGDAGMAIGAPFVAVAQVAMGVDLDQHEVAVDGLDGPGKAA